MAPCVWCGAGSAPQRCARCGQAWYCSKECQKSHWRQEYGGHPTHKAWCVPEADFAGTVQGFVEQCDGSVEDMEWLDSPVLRYNDRVYDAVCSARVQFAAAARVTVQKRQSATGLAARTSRLIRAREYECLAVLFSIAAVRH